MEGLPGLILVEFPRPSQRRKPKNVFNVRTTALGRTCGAALVSSRLRHVRRVWDRRKEGKKNKHTYKRTKRRGLLGCPRSEEEKENVRTDAWAHVWMYGSHCSRGHACVGDEDKTAASCLLLPLSTMLAACSAAGVGAGRDPGDEGAESARSKGRGRRWRRSGPGDGGGEIK